MNFQSWPGVINYLAVLGGQKFLAEDILPRLDRGVQRGSNPHLLLHKRRSAPVNDGHHEIADNRAVEIKAPAEAAPSVVPYYQISHWWDSNPRPQPLAGFALPTELQRKL
jgi:hypothetical protein